MASKRGGHAVAAAGGQLYALGGFNSVQAIPSCEVFDPRVSRLRAHTAGGSWEGTQAAAFATAALSSRLQLSHTAHR